jgi:hypothetical protein
MKRYSELGCNVVESHTCYLTVTSKPKVTSPMQISNS